MEHVLVYHSNFLPGIPSQDQSDFGLHDVVARFAALAKVILRQENKNLLLFERGPLGVTLDVICPDGRRCGITELGRPICADILAIRRQGENLINALAQLWPSYAVPEDLGVITDGQAVYFSPDSPSLLDDEWLLRAAWGDIRLCCLSGRQTILSRLLGPQRIAIIH